MNSLKLPPLTKKIKIKWVLFSILSFVCFNACNFFNVKHIELYYLYERCYINKVYYYIIIIILLYILLQCFSYHTAQLPTVNVQNCVNVK